MPNILDLPILSRIRRNHGLEHATLTTLARRFPGSPSPATPTRAASGSSGTWRPKPSPRPPLEALDRLRKGERGLAMHPNCGTNFAVAGTLAGLAGATAMLGSGTPPPEAGAPAPGSRPGHPGADRRPAAGLDASSRASPPPAIRGDLSITQVLRQEQGKLVLHRISTKG